MSEAIAFKYDLSKTVGASTGPTGRIGVSGAGSSYPLRVPTENLVMPGPVGDQRLALLQDLKKYVSTGNREPVLSQMTGRGTPVAAAAAYTQDMTGSQWDAFMNQPGVVAIRQQQEMFMAMRDQFYVEYEGKYVAFSDGQILDFDEDDSALLIRTRDLRRKKYVLVIRVQHEYPPAEL